MEKRPQRPVEDFKSIKFLLEECAPTGDGVYAINDLAKTTCRTCFGFGHSQKKCPTEVKVKGFKMGNPFVRTVFANFNAYANSKWLAIKSMAVHPVAAYYKDYFSISDNAT